MRSEIEKSIHEDIRDMKRIGRNIKYQKGKRGYVGIMYDANRGMSEKKIKEKYDGETRVYNMGDILSIKEFKYLSEDMRKLHLQAWRQRFSNKEIAQAMGIGYSTLANMCASYGLTGGDNPRPKRKSKNETSDNIVKVSGGTIGYPKSKNNAVAEKGIELNNKQDKATIKKEKQDNLKSLVTLNETTKGEKLSTRLQALAMLINDDEEYTIELTIKR